MLPKRLLSTTTLLFGRKKQVHLLAVSMDTL